MGVQERARNRERIDRAKTIKNQTKVIRGLIKFNRYQMNLRYEHPYVISYTTKVAIVEGDTLRQLGWWSVTTQRHINYAAEQLGKDLDRNGN